MFNLLLFILYIYKFPFFIINFVILKIKNKNLKNLIFNDRHRLWRCNKKYF